MALPTIFPPSSLPPFLSGALEWDDDDAYAQVPRARGHSRLRDVKSDPPSFATCSWILNNAQAADFFFWFEETLKAGTEHFTAGVQDFGPGLKYYDAVVLEGKYQSEAVKAAGGKQGRHYRISFTIVLQGDGEEERPVLASLASEVVIALTGRGIILGDTSLASEAVIALEPSKSLASEAVIALHTVPRLASEAVIALFRGVQLASEAVIALLPGSPAGGDIALTMPASEFDVTGSPGDNIVVSWKVQNANRFFAGPTSGSPAAPTFRAFGLTDLPAIADNSVLANLSGGSASPVATTINALLEDIFGTTQGSVVYYNGSSWVSLGPGSAGQYLKSQGPAANVVWDTPSGGGGGGGTSKVTKSAVSLGSQAASQTAFTYYTVASTAARGMVSEILITSSVRSAFDVVVRGAGSDAGSLWLEARNVDDLTYRVTLPFYYENDAAGQDFFIGIRNAGLDAPAYTLTFLRVEKFA